jgi:hypothetical protein
LAGVSVHDRERERWVAAKPAGEWLGPVIFEKVNDEEVMPPGSTAARAAQPTQRY